MNSKEALEILFSSYNFDGNYHDLIIARKKLEQSLYRLEQFEKENKGLEELVWKKVKELVNEEYRSKELYDKNIELKQENTKLKKALDILKRLVGVNSIVIFPKERVVDITQEEYELLKSVLEE